MPVHVGKTCCGATRCCRGMSDNVRLEKEKGLLSSPNKEAFAPVMAAGAGILRHDVDLKPQLLETSWAVIALSAV